MPGRGHVAAGSIAMQKARQRMAEILRILPGSSLVVAPSDKDLASPEVGAGLEESFGGGGYTALQRAALLQLAADHVSSALDGRESAFELHANGGIVAWRGAAPARASPGTTSWPTACCARSASTCPRSTWTACAAIALPQRRPVAPPAAGPAGAPQPPRLG